MKKAYLMLVFSFIGMSLFSQGNRWTEKQIQEWYDQQEWFCGVNYIPSNAINYTAMWDKTSFSPDLIDKELALAESIGLNCVRVVLQYAVYADDPKYFLRTFDRFLTICNKHGIKVMPCFFDDCVFGVNTDPAIGVQPEPLEGWYAWAWSPSPGHTMVYDQRTYPKLERYVTEVMTRFKNDQRVFIWDLYNEPTSGKVDYRSLPLVKSVFSWARRVDPVQPITIGIWADDKVLNGIVLANSDIITFHCYDNRESTTIFIDSVKQHNRPVICTEWMNRPQKSTVEDILPLFKERNVGCLLWGLVNGKTQTHLPWGHRPENLPYTGVWQHDLFKGDFEPYKKEETELIKELTNRTYLYAGNIAPLNKNSYMHLPLGAVKPEGWLKRQLQIQAEGLSGHVYSDFKADYWSIENYYEGIVSLAYVLDDPKLKKLAKECVDKFLGNDTIRDFNCKENYNVQHGLRFLVEYYEATEDARIIPWLTKYFIYNENVMPSTRFPGCCDYGSRMGENLIALYWLYNKTGDGRLLKISDHFKEYIEILTKGFMGFPEAFPSKHGVDIAQEIKYPALYYQHYKDDRYKTSVFEGLKNIDRFYGQLGGRFAGHEQLPKDKSRGLEPTNGTELCAVIELAYSMERIFEILGDISFADRLELIVYNSIPGTMTPDMWAHQYDQQTNQVLVDTLKRVFDNDKSANLYGLMPHYSCCLANMHSGWPRFVGNMWMATNDKGLIATVYGPSNVKAYVGNGELLQIAETTDYPFKGDITFEITTEKPVSFPLHFRIPLWSGGARILINSKEIKVTRDSVFTVNRRWKDNDRVQLILPMKPRIERRFNNAMAIARGPIYFSLRIGQKFTQLNSVNEFDPEGLKNAREAGFPVHNWQIEPTTPWNYALSTDESDVEESISVTINEISEFPFAQNGEPLYVKSDKKAGWDRIIWNKPEPVILKVKGALIDGWGMKQGSADNPPISPVKSQNKIEILELVPYGSARLRISEFPSLKK
jgi:hypothetical protein